jgi:hypothetical protein
MEGNPGAGDLTAPHEEEDADPEELTYQDYTRTPEQAQAY